MHFKIITKIFLGFCVALFAGCIVRNIKMGSPNLIIVTRYQPGISSERVEVAWPDLVSEWESFFPNYAVAQGVRDGGFAAEYEVIFMRPDGTASWVAASKEKWTNGRGNFATHGDIDALYTKTTNYLHYMEVNWPRAEIQEDGTIRANFRAELLPDGTLRRLDPSDSATNSPSVEP